MIFTVCFRMLTVKKRRVVKSVQSCSPGMSVETVYLSWPVLLVQVSTLRMLKQSKVCSLQVKIIHSLRPKKNICVFQVSRPYLGFCPDSKHFIVNCEQNVVKFAGKWGKMYRKMQFLYKICRQNKMLCRPTIPSFFRTETWNTHILFWPYDLY